MKEKLISSILTNENELSNTPKINYFQESRITKKTKVEPTTPSIFINEGWACTQGDIMLVSGQKKVGKSNILIYVLATALMREVDETKTLGIRSVYAENEIIFIDTEQSKSKTKEFLIKACKVAGYENETEPKNLIFANFRHYNMEERMFALIDCFNDYPNASLLVMDGITDFLDSVNNEEASKKVIDLVLKQLTQKTSVVMTIHEGKDGGGSRGHIGQEAERKCVCNVSVSKDRKTEIHKISCKMIRDGRDFDDILFKWDKELHGFARLDDMMVKAISEKSEETKNNELKDILKRIFATSTTLDKNAVVTGFLNYDTSINKTTKLESQKTACKRKIDKAFDLELLKLNENLYTLNI